MDHIAILKKARVTKGDNLLANILSGTKTIESRWYLHKISPWNQVKIGDKVYFKESGCPVTAVAKVARVLQFENLNNKTVKHIIRKYGKQIVPNSSESEFLSWVLKQNKRYCILMFLKEARPIKPILINKKGFGSSCAWMVVGDIKRVLKPHQFH